MDKRTRKKFEREKIKREVLEQKVKDRDVIIASLVELLETAPGHTPEFEFLNVGEDNEHVRVSMEPRDDGEWLPRSKLVAAVRMSLAELHKRPVFWGCRAL